MTIDERQLQELMTQSKDLQVDAMRAAKESLPELREIGAERQATAATEERPRRELFTQAGRSGGSFASKSLLAGGFGAALMALVARPASAQANQDVAMLQTASSLEALAVATYEAALGLDFIKNGNKIVVAFAKETQSQHLEHKKAFQAQTTALGGKVQDAPNPQFLAVVEKAKPTLKTPLDVVKLAATLEKVATDTYLTDLTKFGDKKSIEIMGSVMGVEAQHLAVLRAVGALLEANAPQFIAIPVDLANLPAAAGSVAFPAAFEDTPAELLASPESGAVK